MQAPQIERTVAPALARLAALTPLDAAATAALQTALDRPRNLRARRDFIVEGREITETLLLLSGWAARVRILPDGRRQILNFLLPGDLIGLCGHDDAVASSTVAAITDVVTCVAPDAAVSPTLARAYSLSRAIEEAHLLAQITRLGRMTAYEKIADLLLELSERLELAGLAAGGRFPLPLTQEMVGDALGLTSVHVNRMLQGLRRDGSIDWKGREVVLSNPAALRRSIGRSMVSVTSGQDAIRAN